MGLHVVVSNYGYIKHTYFWGYHYTDRWQSSAVSKRIYNLSLYSEHNTCIKIQFFCFKVSLTSVIHDPQLGYVFHQLYLLCFISIESYKTSATETRLAFFSLKSKNISNKNMFLHFSKCRRLTFSTMIYATLRDRSLVSTNGAAKPS